MRKLLAFVLAACFAGQTCVGAPSCLAAEIVTKDSWIGSPVWSPDRTMVIVRAHALAAKSGTPEEGEPANAFYVLNSQDYSVISELVDCFELQWSPDGKHILQTSYNQALIVDPRTGKTEKDLTEKFNCEHAWSPDSGRVAMSGKQHVLIRGAINSDKLINRVECEIPAGYSGSLKGPLLWSGDGKYIASIALPTVVAEQDRKPEYCVPNRVCIWESSTGKLIKTFDCATASPNIAWTPDEKTFVLSLPGSLNFYTSRDFAEVRSFRTNSVMPVKFLFSPDKRKIAYADVQLLKQIRLSDLKQLVSIEGPSNGRFNFQYSSDAKFLFLYSPNQPENVVGIGGYMAICRAQTGQYVCWGLGTPDGALERMNLLSRLFYKQDRAYLVQEFMEKIDWAGVRKGLSVLPGGSTGKPGWFESFTPKTVEDAYAAFDKEMPSHVRKDFQFLPESDIVLTGGMADIVSLCMVDECSKWNLNELRKEFAALEIFSIDDVRSIVLHSYWRKLNGKPILLQEQINAISNARRASQDKPGEPLP